MSRNVTPASAVRAHALPGMPDSIRSISIATPRKTATSRITNPAVTKPERFGRSTQPFSRTSEVTMDCTGICDGVGGRGGVRWTCG